ncbi:glycosyl transferase family 1 [Tenacibaculum sp. SZ-18]|uniref:glycosyltransferase family 4 protein n=1 Tax=Tenacibaculum sp. SZ-18 TaxID=754423 RepID=UPI000C2CEC4E|nr:glycosyltransferase family 4 protein [Tenacibaculum sp. SZ-18]AUC14480.1 glycosyl transferase family 1 [Tenacibaculum sp. SZ-18]
MKVLIVTYYWPPAGGAGVQRWLKFTKYLRDFGIEPVIFTADNPHYPILDDSLQRDIPDGVEVIKCPIFEPNGLLYRLKKRKVKNSAGFLEENPSLLSRLLIYIRANLFIPDARMFWIKPSVKKIKKYLSQNEIDVLITTGPPHSLHMIGYHVKKKTGIKWIADFRDPWTGIDYFHLLPLTNFARKKHFRQEDNVFKNSDKVIMVSKTSKEKYKNQANSIEVITNGYDTDSIEEESIVLDEKFTISHIGSMNAARNPKKLWKVLAELCEDDEEFSNDLQIQLIGKLDEKVVKEYINPYQFKNILHRDYIPHKEAKQYQKQSQVLLLVVNDTPNAKEIVTGKVFEYLQAKRPIIAIGPEDGDLADVLKETKSGSTFHYDNRDGLKEEIRLLYGKYKLGKLKIESSNIEKYHRKQLTEHLSYIIKELIKK